jgi:hypothetical protein
MKKKQNLSTSEMIDQISRFAEALAGLKNSLVAQGFSEEIAAEIVLQSLRKQANGQ